MIEERLIMEEKELNLKEFDLEAAKAGKPVCTRDGRKARIICFDRKFGSPIVALVEVIIDEKLVDEEIMYYTIDGRAAGDEMPSEDDLMMLPEKKEGYIFMRRTTYVFDNKEVAERKCPVGHMVVKVEWEE